MEPKLKRAFHSEVHQKRIPFRGLRRFASSQDSHPSPPGKPEVSVVSLLLLPHAKANLCMGTHVQRKRPRPRKEIRFAAVSHDPAATQPGTVSHRAERISNCESIARLRRPCQKQAPNLQAAQPSCTHHPSAVREASPRSAMHKYPLTKFPFPVC